MSSALDELKDFNDERQVFFATIGRYITSYQQVEEYVLDVFVTALGGDPMKATAIFHTVRGLEARLNVVAAALTGDAERQARWRDLASRIGAAAAARNSIAHARPRHNGGHVQALSKGPPGAPGEPVSFERLSPSAWSS